VAAFNSSKRAILGYVFKREEYPWLQYWGNYPADTQVVRGMEFGTQPYDLPRREIITDGPMFGTPVYRWLPAKSKIESHFLLFLRARVGGIPARGRHNAGKRPHSDSGSARATTGHAGSVERIIEPLDHHPAHVGQDALAQRPHCALPGGPFTNWHFSGDERRRLNWKFSTCGVIWLPFRI
jgi:hypothetical protein